MKATLIIGFISLCGLAMVGCVIAGIKVLVKQSIEDDKELNR